MIVWPFIPRMTPIESLEWETNIIRSKKAEQRRCKRPFPRISYQYEYSMDEDVYGIARELARNVGGSRILIPDWPNATQVPDVSAGTASFPVDASFAPALYAGAQALVFGDNVNYEVVTITGVGTGTVSTGAIANSYTKPWIVPTRIGSFAQAFTGPREPQDWVKPHAVFQCEQTEDLFALGNGTRIPSYMYRGDPLIPDPVELINGVNDENQHETVTVDCRSGLLYRYHTQATPTQSFALGWTASNAEELWNLRVWLHTRRGRWKQFWTSSWNADVAITRDITVGDTTIEIAAIGFADKYPRPSDFAIVAADGGFWAFRVTNATTGAPGRELLTLESGFSGTLRVSFIAKACKLTLSRLDSDRIDIQHLPGRQATIAVATKEVPVYP